MTLRVVYRNWSADGTPHVHSFEADSWSIPADGSLLVRSGSQTVACVAHGEWMGVWRPEAVEGAAPAPAAPAAKAQKAAPAAPAGGGDAAPEAPAS